MKIVEAINSMIINAEKITNVIKNNREYFFLYHNKYKWSIMEKDDDFILFLYPKDDISLETLSGWDSDMFAEYSEMVIFRSDEIKTKESKESFSDLYATVSAKVFGVDDILDDIIGDSLL